MPMGDAPKVDLKRKGGTGYAHGNDISTLFQI